MSILEVKGLKKTYTTRFGGNQVQALKNVSFSVEDSCGTGQTNRRYRIVRRQESCRHQGNCYGRISP